MLTIVNTRVMLTIVNIPPMSKTLNSAAVGALARQARVTAGLSQTELGRRIGASRFWVAQFEKGKPSAELGLALRAMHALGLTVHIEPKDASQRARVARHFQQLSRRTSAKSSPAPRSRRQPRPP